MNSSAWIAWSAFPRSAHRRQASAALALAMAGFVVAACSSTDPASPTPCERCKPDRITCVTISGESVEYRRGSYDATKCTYNGSGVTPGTVEVECDPDAGYPAKCL